MSYIKILEFSLSLTFSLCLYSKKRERPRREPGQPAQPTPEPRLTSAPASQPQRPAPDSSPPRSSVRSPLSLPHRPAGPALSLSPRPCYAASEHAQAPPRFRSSRDRDPETPPRPRLRPIKGQAPPLSNPLNPTPETHQSRRPLRSHLAAATSVRRHLRRR